MPEQSAREFLFLGNSLVLELKDGFGLDDAHTYANQYIDSYDPRIHVIEYDGPRGYKALIDAHDFQVKLNRELQSLLKQCEPKITELESTREKLATCVTEIQLAIDTLCEHKKHAILVETLAKIKADK